MRRNSAVTRNRAQGQKVAPGREEKNSNLERFPPGHKISLFRAKARYLANTL